MRDRRSALTTAAMLLAICAGVLAGCRARQRSEAGEAYRKELRAHQARFQEFHKRYPSIELRLAEAREKNPPTVARTVEGELLPLLDRLVKGYESMVRRGRAYVALLPPSVEAREALRQQLDVFEEQGRIMDQIRRSYRDEASLFRTGRADRGALDKILARRAAATRRMQDGP